jgi:hypothetical protein
MAKKTNNIGSINGSFFSPFGAQDLDQSGKFGTVAIGGPVPVAWTGTAQTLPAGERMLNFTFNAVAGDSNKVPEITLKTTGPFELWDGFHPVTKTITLAMAAGGGQLCYIILNPQKAGKQKGDLTLKVKDVELTGTFKNGTAFKLSGDTA